MDRIFIDGINHTFMAQLATGPNTAHRDIQIRPISMWLFLTPTLYYNGCLYRVVRNSNNLTSTSPIHSVFGGKEFGLIFKKVIGQRKIINQLI